MIVLVTRPSPSGEALVSKLNQQNTKAYHTPLIKFSAGRELIQLSKLLAELTSGDMLFAASQPAVYYADRYLRTEQPIKKSTIYWPTDIRYFAIGQKTMQALQMVTNCSVLSPINREISEHLLQLTELQSITGKKMLILRGNGGRNFLANALQQRGAQVKFCECYQRVPISYNGEILSTSWQDYGVNTLVITSAEMLQQLFELVPERTRPWLLACRLIVVSERIADLARQYGWQKIEIADNADNDSLLKALNTQI